MEAWPVSGGGSSRNRRSNQPADEAVTKRELLEEKKNKWMRDREISLLNDRVRTEHNEKYRRSNDIGSNALSVDYSRPSGGHEKGSISGDNNSSGSSSSGLPNESSFLNNLTEKLTAHIRTEVQREMLRGDRATIVRDSVAEKVESYLQNELQSTHTCKICFEIMRSPIHTPVLLFPCGHTFCKQCIEHNSKTSGGHISSDNKSFSLVICPYCREPIKSRAINQSLKEVIDQIHAHTEYLSDNPHLCLDEPQRRAQHKQGAALSTSGSKDDSSSSSYNNSNSSSIRQQLSSCLLRQNVMLEELRANGVEETEMERRLQKVTAASQHLQREKTKIEEHIRQLQEERDLVDRHLLQQKEKERAVEKEATAAREKRCLVRDTLSSLEREIDKLKLLS